VSACLSNRETEINSLTFYENDISAIPIPELQDTKTPILKEQYLSKNSAKNILNDTKYTVESQIKLTHNTTTLNKNSHENTINENEQNRIEKLNIGNKEISQDISSRAYEITYRSEISYR
jgi:hypothetical protein